MEEDQKQNVEIAGQAHVKANIKIPFPDTFFYSSVSAYAMTMMDIKIGFGEAMPDQTVAPRVGVTLPIEHAAHVALTLIGQLVGYEQAFGPIRHAPWREFVLKHLSESTQPEDPQVKES